MSKRQRRRNNNVKAKVKGPKQPPKRRIEGPNNSKLSKKQKTAIRYRMLWKTDSVLNKIYGEEIEPIVDEIESLDQMSLDVRSVLIVHRNTSAIPIPFKPDNTIHNGYAEEHLGRWPEFPNT